MKARSVTSPGKFCLGKFCLVETPDANIGLVAVPENGNKLYTH